jgi:hypothetical protein
VCKAAASRYCIIGGAVLLQLVHPRVGAYCIWTKSAAGHLAAHDGVLHPVRHICMHTTRYVREWNTDTREPRLQGGVGTHTDTKTRNRSARHPSGQEPVVGPATPPVMSSCAHGKPALDPSCKKGGSRDAQPTPHRHNARY